MTIAYLDNLGFKEEKEDINKLKISLGTVEFDENSKTFKITKPDLRYYWDVGRFGMHVSDWDFSTLDWITFLKDNIKIVDKITVLYFGRTQVETFSILTYNFDSLEFLYLSENSILSYVDLKELDKLVKFEAALCPNLLKVEFTGNFGLLNSIDLSNSNLNTFSLQNADFPSLESINISGNPFKDKGIFTFHTAPVLHYVYGLKTMAGINQDHFEGSDLNVRKLVADQLISDLAKEIINPFSIGKEPDLSKNYKLNNEDYIYFIDLGHLGLDVNDRDKLPERLFNIFSLEHLCLGAYYPNKLNVFDNIIWKKSFYHEKTGANFNVLSSSELEKLKDLPNLKSLYLNSIDLDSLDFLTSLPNLQSLDVTGNSRLNNFENVLSLKELKLFHASSIKGFDDWQTKYLPSSVISLSLESCKITNLSFLERLTNLKFTFLGCNQISTNNLLDFLFTKNGKPNRNRILQIKYTNYGEPGIYINENPIEEGLFSYLDSKDIKEKERLLLSYYTQYQFSNEEIRFKQVKLILLGNTKAGKTTFFDILNSRTKGYKMKSKGNESTHGVNITTIERLNQENEPEFVLKVYDFGGQDYYHSTHWPYFTQTDTQYMLIYRNDREDVYGINEKNESLFPLDYWLDSIRKYCMESDSTKPIATKVDLLQNLFTPKTQDLNLKDLKHRYNNQLNINNLSPCNLAKKRDHKKLKNELNKEFQERLENTIKNETAVEKARYEFIKKIKQSPKGIIKKSDIKLDEDKTEDWLEVSLDFAFSTNDIIYSKEGDYKDFIVTDIEKFNSYLFKILKNEKDGYFNKAEVSERLRGTGLDSNEIQFILDFMILHEIIFVTEENNYLAPSFLSNELSESEKILVETFNVPLIEYSFKAHFHSNIFTKIVIKFSKIKNDTTFKLLRDDEWKFVLKKGHVFLYQSGIKNSEVSNDLEEQAFNKNLLYIKFELKPLPTIKVYNHSLFGVQPDMIDEIHKILDLMVDYIKMNELVVYNQNIQKLVYNKYGKRIDFRKLKNETLISSDGKRTDLIHYENQLFRLGDFRLFLDPTVRNQLKMKKIFISYSKFDEIYKDEFKSHLATLKSQDLIETFDDRDIESGDKFDMVIKQKITECDLFICLISRHFLNVKYIFEQEFPYALKNKKTIIPIIIRPCDWEGMPVGSDGERLGDWNAHDKAQVLTLRPITKNDISQEIVAEYSSNERDYMWLKLVKKIREIIENEPIPPISPPPPNEHPTGYH